MFCSECGAAADGKVLLEVRYALAWRGSCDRRGHGRKPGAAADVRLVGRNSL